MSEPVVSAIDSEAQFAELVDFLAADPVRREKLNNLLAENHPCYNERSGAEIVRLRGWVLLALARTGLSERQPPFLLEEFDAGTDVYLVGAAAAALASYPHRHPAFAPL